MNVRLIKPSMLTPVQEHDQPPREVSVIDRIESWVREFQSKRADRVRLDFERMSSAAKK